MKIRTLIDYRGRPVRLTPERVRHILGHSEMHGLMPLIEQALREPERVIQSLSDSDVELFYRLLPKRRVGIQWLCVVVKHRPEDAFLLTAYLTNQPKKGKVLWHAK